MYCDKIIYARCYNIFDDDDNDICDFDQFHDVKISLGSMSSLYLIDKNNNV